MLVYLAKGILPWMKIEIKSRIEKFKAIGKMKKKMRIAELCKSMPKVAV